MTIEIKVPSPGESISEVQLANWLVEDGTYVEKDQEIAEIDSDKATLSISAEAAGKIKLLAETGTTLQVGAVIASIDTTAEAPAGAQKKTAPKEDTGAGKAEEKPKVPAPAETASSNKREEQPVNKDQAPVRPLLSPLAKKLLEANNLSESEFLDFLKTYRFGKKDVEFFLNEKDSFRSTVKDTGQAGWNGQRETERKKMTTLRLKLAERLVAVKNETAMLTTFNEVNMSPIMDIRNRYKETFKEKFGVSLGFMSFFTRAVTEALQLFPQVNAHIDGEEMVYHSYADIGIAVSTPKGLMVPVLRNAESMSLADIELGIKELAIKARDNKITLDDMKGGTFTITNGGVFGSMLSTPIINPPQSAILGMHNIVERPIAVNGQVEIHPIMYVALSYDHRVIDGRESVSFLVKVKEMLENPAKMLYGGREPVEKLLGI
jgi:2-oxoglutarate dehydrogenase E2 component (dihydrolipoamide succinyltransferase)